MRILLVTNMYPNKSATSYGVFVKNIHLGLTNNESNLVYLCAMTRTNGKLLPYIYLYCKFIYLLLTKKIDIVYCHFISRTALLGFIAKYIFRKKLVFNLHGSDYLLPALSNSSIHKINEYALEVADGVVVPSRAFLDRVKELSPTLCKSNFFVSPSGGVFRPEKVKYFSEPTDSLCCLYIGQISEAKGLSVLKSALEEVDFKISLILIGKQCPKFNFKVANPLVTLNLIGEVVQSDLVMFYKSAHVLVFPTLYFESLGLSPIEAMAYGLPVIASNYGPIPEYVHNNLNGYLFKKGDHKDLLVQLNKFNGLSLGAKQDLSMNAFKTAGQYSRHEVIIKLQRFLESCFEKK
ncbi:glycosyltransferase family 4 protein [Pseudoalteromonas sp. NZS71]|uniref:glycosyltransferase family 4 protein n=1 Tax=Pseudoalteromonas sp. NZS71 TaxID=2792052 RepID=UPI0018CD0C3F|nr:glycosyltransferase family 4 protein [Pseudoalteromonas sp. NZS71]MBH0060035.1 glycosyltransferase family 4 protein [Pseudoalteromonas sp. NZS71]